MLPESFSARCTSCGANWTEGQWTAGCGECGGGALEQPCLICGGRCGATWRRAVLDSNDFRCGHWHGACGLPEEEKERLLAEARGGEGGPDGSSSGSSTGEPPGGRSP